MDGGKYILTSEALIPGHIANWLLLIALIHVDFVGMKHAAWSNRINFVVVDGVGVVALHYACIVVIWCTELTLVYDRLKRCTGIIISS